MVENKLGQEPVFPLDNISIKQVEEGYGIGNYGIGISKRLYIASMILPGLAVAHSGGFNTIETNVEEAYEYADELLKQENNGN